MHTITHRLVVVALLALVACASVLSYEPTASMSADDAKLLIRRTLEEQPPGFGANDIEVTDEKLSFVRGESRYFGPIPTTSYTEATKFYFEGFKSAEISGKRRKGHVVWVFDEAGTPRFRVVVPTEEGAKRFVDALYVLSMSARSNAAER